MNYDIGVNMCLYVDFVFGICVFLCTSLLIVFLGPSLSSLSIVCFSLYLSFCSVVCWSASIILFVCSFCVKFFPVDIPFSFHAAPCCTGICYVNLCALPVRSVPFIIPVNSFGYCKISFHTYFIAGTIIDSFFVRKFSKTISVLTWQCSDTYGH